MIICEAQKFAFVHIPKNGGTSIRKALSEFVHDPRFEAGRVVDLQGKGQLDHVHIPLFLLEALYPDAMDKLQSYRSFAVIREPYSRFQSALNQWAKNVRKERLMDLPESKVAEYVALHLLNDGIQERTSPSLIHFLPQTAFTFLKGKQVVDLLVPFEQLDTMWPRILNHIDVDPTLVLSKENPSMKYRSRLARGIAQPLRKPLNGAWSNLPIGIKQFVIKQFLIEAKSEQKTRLDIKSIIETQGLTANFLKQYQADMSLYRELVTS